MELSIALVKTLVDTQYSIFAAIDAWLAPSLSVFVLVVDLPYKPRDMSMFTYRQFVEYPCHAALEHIV